MATIAKRAIRQAEAGSEDLIDNLSSQIGTLRKEIASISAAVSDYGGGAFGDVQHNALALAKEVRKGGKMMVRQMGRQAGHAGKTVRNNPVPVIVVLGTLALLSSLIFSRD